MKAVLKAIAILLLLAGAALYFLTNHSVRAREFTCDGELSSETSTTPDRAFVVLNEYSWWVVWAETDGNLTTQLDKAALAHYIPKVQKIGDGFLAAYMFSEHDGKFAGGLRMANAEIVLSWGQSLKFVGKCREGRTGLR